MAACATCGTANPVGARFCNGCAAPLAAPAPVREERKTVTVLFADLAGFTARAESLDPEDVRNFLAPYYDVLRAEVEARGGRVERYLGDGVMALFGAPVAHEDDPERAVRAALRIVWRVPDLGLDLHVRIGINTGQVLFAAATGGERDDAVTGDAVNTAARLQAAASVDTAMVGEATYRATADLFRYVALEPIAAKGKAEPVPAWRPLAPVARPTWAVSAETTPFVGRAFELDTLVRLFERSGTRPSVECVTIVAEPGIGKSRLVRELARHVDALPDLVTWRVGRCLPFGDGISFWPLGEIVAAHAGILDTDDQIAIRAKLDAVVTVPDPAMRSWIRDRVGPLVGLQVAAQPPQQEEAFTAWRRFLESIARERPLVLVVEDLHWADDAMVAFLLHLVANTAGLPVLLVATARPEVEDRHAAWLARARHATVLSLDVLDDRHMATLVEAALPDATPELIATVLDRAGGSPLYAGQLAAMLRDRPSPMSGTVDESVIPPGIAALLAARIDILAPDAKALLLDASVVGRTFWSGAVVALGGRDPVSVEPLLVDLAHRDLVRPVYPSSMADEAEYAFVHALVRDVAYGELPRAARLARHQAAAAWLSERTGGGFGDDAEIVVAHLEQALDLARAMGARDRAPAIEMGLVDALLAAATHALGAEEGRAERHLRRALELFDRRDSRWPTTLAALGRALLGRQAIGEATQTLGAAERAYREAGDLVAVAELAPSLATARANSGDIAGANAVLDEAQAVLEEHRGPGLAEVIAAKAMRASVAGHAALAESLAAESIEVSEGMGLPPAPRALVARGAARMPLAPGAGEADFRRAVELEEARGAFREASQALVNLAECRLEIQGPGACLEVLDEAIAYSAEHGLSIEWPRGARVDALLPAGRWDELLEEVAAIRAWAASQGDAGSTTYCARAEAAVRLERGEPVPFIDDLVLDAERAGLAPTFVAGLAALAAVAAGDRAAARQTLGYALDRTQPTEVVELVHLVRACLASRSLELARRALALGSVQGALNETSTAAAQAMLAEAEGDFGAARDGYRPAAAAFSGFGVVPEQAHALAGLGRCLLALGETEEGIARLGESREIWERLRATPRIAEIDALLATVE